MAEERQYEEIEAPEELRAAEETPSPAVTEENAEDDGTMSLVAHLTELRSRLRPSSRI